MSYMQPWSLGIPDALDASVLRYLLDFYMQPWGLGIPANFAANLAGPFGNN